MAHTSNESDATSGLNIGKSIQNVET